MTAAGDTPITSRQLLVLQQAIQAGNSAALNAFWDEVRVQCTPLVEPIAGDETISSVTFVFRGGDEVQNVALVSNLSGQSGASEPLTRLPQSDVWYRSYVLPNDARESYQFTAAGKTLLDPCNPKRFHFPDDPETNFSGWESSVFELSDAPPQTWNIARPELPQGQLAKHRFRFDALDNEYNVWVYVPPDVPHDAAPCGWLLLFDGWFYIKLIPVPTILNNLIAAARLPPLAAVLIGNPFDKHRRRDLACNPRFEEAVMSEIVPWARNTYHLTTDPSRTIVAGASLGGLMAAYMGLRHSDTFGNVLVQSGFFGWKPDEGDEDEWIVRQYAATPRLPLRFSIEAGLFETNQPTPLPGLKNLLKSARAMRGILRTKGYVIHYSEFSGGHNPLVWRGTFADRLVELLGTAPQR